MALFFQADVLKIKLDQLQFFHHKYIFVYLLIYLLNMFYEEVVIF